MRALAAAAVVLSSAMLVGTPAAGWNQAHGDAARRSVLSLDADPLDVYSNESLRLSIPDISFYQASGRHGRIARRGTRADQGEAGPARTSPGALVA